jgi:hypothetical protein
VVKHWQDVACVRNPECAAVPLHNDGDSSQRQSAVLDSVDQGFRLQCLPYFPAVKIQLLGESLGIVERDLLLANEVGNELQSELGSCPKEYLVE